MLSGINNSLSTVGILVSCVSALLLAIIVAYLWENNIIFLVARKLRLSHKVNNLEVWQCLFDEQPWVIVRDYISENVYYGKVIQYSDSSDMREIVVVRSESMEQKRWRIYHGKSLSCKAMLRIFYRN